MKLYTTDASPFGARVRIQIDKKKLPVEILPPPGGLGSDELRRLSPLGMIPVLELKQSVIIESTVIQEYLEDIYPQPSLRGDTPEQAACIRTLSRITDIHLLPALQPLRSYLGEEVKDRSKLNEAVQDLQKVFTSLEHFTRGKGYAVSNKLSLADCSMAPMFNYLVFFSQLLDIDLSLSSFPCLSTWMSDVRSDEAVDKVLCEIEAARK